MDSMALLIMGHLYKVLYQVRTVIVNETECFLVLSSYFYTKSAVDASQPPTAYIAQTSTFFFPCSRDVDCAEQVEILLNFWILGTLYGLTSGEIPSNVVCGCSHEEQRGNSLS